MVLLAYWSSCIQAGTLDMQSIELKAKLFGIPVDLSERDGYIHAW